MSQPPRSRQKQQPTPTRTMTPQQRRDAVAKRLKSLAAEDEAGDRTLVRRSIPSPATASGEMTIQTRIEAIPPWLARHRRSLVIGFGGLVAGVILACLFLALLAPQPEAVTATRASGNADGTATLDDTYLTDLLTDSLAQASLPIGVNNVKAHAKAGNEIDVSGDLAGVPTLPGQSARRLTATLQLSIVDGALHAHIESIDFGGLGLPGLVTNTLESQINAHLALPALTQAGGHRYIVTSLTTKDGSLTMTLKRS